MSESENKKGKQKNQSTGKRSTTKRTHKKTSSKSSKSKLEKLNIVKKRDESTFEILFMDEEEFKDEYNELFF